MIPDLLNLGVFGVMLAPLYFMVGYLMQQMKRMSADTMQNSINISYIRGMLYTKDGDNLQ